MIFSDGSLTYDLLVLLVALFCVLFAYFKWSFTYWKRKNVPFRKPTFPFGNLGDIMTQKTNVGMMFKTHYDYFNSRGHKHGGLYHFAAPVYIPCDVDIIKSILIKDFSNFVNRGVYVNENDDFNKNLFTTEGDHWKGIRSQLSPTFTSGKLKMMFDTILQVCNTLEKVIDANSEGVIELKQLFSCYTTDVIGSTAFGIECNSLENPDILFRKFSQRSLENSPLEAFKALLAFAVPKKYLDIIQLKFSKTDVEEFFIDIVTQTVAKREANNIYRKDFMHLLIQLKNRGEVSDDNKIFSDKTQKAGSNLSVREMAAQAALFFLAGFETSASTTTMTLFELAQDQKIQSRVRQEILDVLEKHDGQFTYEAVTEMKYLDQVIDEILRKYPPLAFLNRITSNDYKVPGTDLVLEKDTMIFLSIMGLHYDPQYFPDPDKFDPERFSTENKSKIPSGVYIPFGAGPRNCIGMRLGLLQVKLGLARVIKNHIFELDTQKTKTPFVFDNKSFTQLIKGGIFTKVTKV